MGPPGAGDYCGQPELKKGILRNSELGEPEGNISRRKTVSVK